jgi:peptide deformylase
MAILPIRTFGDPVLRAKAAVVAAIDDGVRKLVEDMIETMYAAPGVGLAAPQIGVSRAVFVFDAHDGLGARTIINPELVSVDGEWTYEEGCLSVPGYFWPIQRPSSSHVRGIDLDGRVVEHSGDELLGRVLQHEFDHLQGMLLLERLEPKVKKQALRDLRNEALGLISFE